MNRIFITICVIYIFHQPLVSAQSKVENLIIYKNFLRAGITMRLVNAFKYSNNFAGIVDTTNINSNSLIPVQEWIFILDSAKKSKHRQMKVGGVTLAGEMTIANKAHYFIIARPNLIVDLTARRNYRINDKSKNLLESYKARLMILEY